MGWTKRALRRREQRTFGDFALDQILICIAFGSVLICLRKSDLTTHIHIGAKGFFRFFLQYFLRFAKNIANFYTNFCNPQKGSQIFAIVIDLFCVFLR